MRDPIMIQIDDEIRQATPEEAAAIIAEQAEAQPLTTES